MAKTILSIDQSEVVRHESMTMADDFSFSMDLLIATTSWIRRGIPYLYGRTHAIQVIEGSASYEINLRHYDFRRGDLAIISENSILEMNDFTPDYRIRAASLRSEPDAAPYCLLIKGSEEGTRMADEYFHVIESSLGRGFNDKTIDHLTSALREELMALYRKQATTISTASNRNQDLFNRFLSLVSQYSQSERSTTFYANRLFLSPRYLGTVIKSVSGKSLMHWVDLSVANKAKIALRYTDKSMAEISRDLCFDEQTTFTRFFKRVVGTTPSDYRRGKQ